MRFLVVVYDRSLRELIVPGRACVCFVSYYNCKRTKRTKAHHKRWNHAPRQPQTTACLGQVWADGVGRPPSSQTKTGTQLAQCVLRLIDLPAMSSCAGVTHWLTNLPPILNETKCGSPTDVLTEHPCQQRGRWGNVTLPGCCCVITWHYNCVLSLDLQQ